MGKTGSILFVAAAAFGAGAVAGLLFAPASGEENRRRISDQVKSQVAGLDGRLKELEKSISSIEKQIVSSGQELSSKVKDVAARTVDQYIPDVPDVEGNWSIEKSDLASDLPRIPKV